MIKFFRKIRYDLMEKNKTGKYLKYAFGEIVLIVVGIMIALQLNNYNGQKRQEAEMRQSLTELKSELESNLHRFYRVLVWYSNKDGLIRQHLCNTISREDIKNMHDLEIQWFLIRGYLMAPLNRDVLDKVLLDIEYMPAELEDLKVTLRLLDSHYEEMQDNYERYGEISNEEWKYRAEQISWHHELWRWDQPFDEVLRNKVLDYLFDDPHYQNQIYRYWGLMTHNIIEDQLRIRNTAVFYIESISEYLNPSEDHRYQLPEPFRFDLKEIVGTYRNYKKFLGEGQQNLEYGPYILFEADGRLFSPTLYN